MFHFLLGTLVLAAFVYTALSDAGFSISKHPKSLDKKVIESDKYIRFNISNLYSSSSSSSSSNGSKNDLHFKLTSTVPGQYTFGQCPGTPNPAVSFQTIATGSTGQITIAGDSYSSAIKNSGSIWITKDTGATFNPVTQSGLQSQWWYSVAMANDGSKMAGGIYLGPIWLSTNGGSTWTKTGAKNPGNWWEVMCDDDCSVMYGIEYPGYLYLSTNTGANWAQTGSSLQSKPLYWSGIRTSADGKITTICCDNRDNYASTSNAGNGYVGALYITKDTGSTWTQLGPSNGLPANIAWKDVFISSSGQYQYAVARPYDMNKYLCPQPTATAFYCSIYKSSDTGSTWNAMYTGYYFTSVSGSDDGKYVVALILDVGIIASTNYGANPVNVYPSANSNVFDVSMNSDASRIYAVSFLGGSSTDQGGISYNVDLPTSQPTRQPSSQPSQLPSLEPTSQPSGQPSIRPSAKPSSQPSIQPSAQPSMRPSTQPSMQPSHRPSMQPSRHPSIQPSRQPSMKPSRQPLSCPSMQPSRQPSSRPSMQPATHPTIRPSHQPSSRPSMLPSMQPFSHPSFQPSTYPTSRPSMQPSHRPSMQPSRHPSIQPSRQPSMKPSRQPFSHPSHQPSTHPYSSPSMQPSMQPSHRPSGHPSGKPYTKPSSPPTSLPTSLPSAKPSSQPNSNPSRRPINAPTSKPSGDPSVRFSSKPTSTEHPTVLPTTAHPSFVASRGPTVGPTHAPSPHPSVSPTPLPTTAMPTFVPTFRPTAFPTNETKGSDASLLENSGPSSAMISGIVAGALIGVCLVTVVCFMFCRKEKKDSRNRPAGIKEERKKGAKEKWEEFYRSNSSFGLGDASNAKAREKDVEAGDYGTELGIVSNPMMSKSSSGGGSKVIRDDDSVRTLSTTSSSNRSKTPDKSRGKTPERDRGKTPDKLRGKTPERDRAKTPDKSRGKTLDDKDDIISTATDTTGFAFPTNEDFSTLSLPSGWKAKVDEKTGATFYQNKETKITQWEFPVEHSTAAAFNPLGEDSSSRSQSRIPLPPPPRSKTPDRSTPAEVDRGRSNDRSGTGDDDASLDARDSSYEEAEESALKPHRRASHFLANEVFSSSDAVKGSENNNRSKLKAIQKANLQREATASGGSKSSNSKAAPPPLISQKSTALPSKNSKK